MVTPNKVTGKENSEHDIMLFTLSTCVWCKKTKKLLDNLGLSYKFIDVDKLSGQDKAEVMKEVKKFNPQCTFPTMVVDDSKCVVGFKEDQIKRTVI